MSRAARTSSSKLKATARYGQTQVGAPLVRILPALLPASNTAAVSGRRRCGGAQRKLEEARQLVPASSEDHNTHRVARSYIALHCIAEAAAGRVGQELGEQRRSGAFY